MTYLFESKDWECYLQFAGESPLSIPQLFQDVISSDAEIRQSARGTIFQWPEEMLWELGQIGAIPSVVDCLLDLAFHPDVTRPGELLGLSAELVSGLPHFLLSEEFYSDSPLILAEGVWCAFSSYADRFCKAVTSSDAEIRIGAVRCLQTLGRPEDGTAIFQQILCEVDQNVIEACLEALAYFPVPGCIEIAKSHTSHQDQKVQCRAWQLLAVNDNSYPNEAIKELARLVMNSSNDLSEYAKNVLSESKGHVLLGCVLIWIEELKTISVDQLSSFVHSAITATFKCTNYSRTQLSIAERLLLTTLCNTDHYWNLENSESTQKTEAYLSTTLRLPFKRTALEDWLQNESVYIRRH